MSRMTGICPSGKNLERSERPSHAELQDVAVSDDEDPGHLGGAAIAGRPAAEGAAAQEHDNHPCGRCMKQYTSAAAVSTLWSVAAGC